MDERAQLILANISRIPCHGFEGLLNDIANAIEASPQSRFIHVTVSGGQTHLEHWLCDSVKTMRVPTSLQADLFRSKLNLKHKDCVRLVAHGQYVGGALWLEYRVDTSLFLECEYLFND